MPQEEILQFQIKAAMTPKKNRKMKSKLDKKVTPKRKLMQKSKQLRSKDLQISKKVIKDWQKLKPRRNVRPSLKLRIEDWQR